MFVSEWKEKYRFTHIGGMDLFPKPKKEADNERLHKPVIVCSSFKICGNKAVKLISAIYNSEKS